jgi:hypothetical protein
MDFNKLMSRMRELDQPVAATVEACGDPMGMPGMPSQMADQTPPPGHPSMSVNLNAQGMDNIESLMKLMTKVNPDMINQPANSMPGMPSLTPPGPSISSLGNLDSGPLKMLPDFDADNDDMPGGEMDLPPGHDSDHAMIKTLDADHDGDHDMDDHDMEKKDKEEAFGNSIAGDKGPETFGMDAAMPNGDDIHKKKSMHRAAAGGDNAMAAEGTDLRSQIRAELQQRLAEAKGAK